MVAGPAAAAEAEPTDLTGGGGRDTLRAADGDKDDVRCGSGKKDRFAADGKDKVRDCERRMGARRGG